MKILLVSTLYDESVSQYRGIGKLKSLQAKGFLVPLNLATLAALTPDGVEVDLWDEPVHGQIDESTDFKNDYDLVGISCYVHRIPRAKEIAQLFRQRGIPVAIGGPGVSSAPERCRNAFDILFIGEAEYTWPQFIADFQAGNFKSEYRQITKVDLADSPIPRWDGIADHIKEYLVGAVQTTRGCPFDCEFCDVIYLFGRQPRHKPIDRVLEEISVLQHLGMRSIFFSDDNFAGNIRYAKDLLKEVIALNRTFEKPIAFQTQLSINIARDDELLELLADANLSQALIGIESPNKESLKETNKLQNLRGDLVEDCRKIMSYGIPIKAAMIAGFDHDDTSIFDQQFEFLQDACIPIPSLHVLEATDGTRLWARLYKEGRIVSNVGSSYRGRRFETNIIPERMTRVELFEGYAHLVERTFDWNNFAARVKGMVSLVKRRPNIPNASSDVSEADLDKALFFIKMAQRSGMIDKLPASEGEDGKVGLGLLKDFFLLEDKKIKENIFDIIRHTVRHAPFMLDKVMKIIALQYSEWFSMQSYIEVIYQHIKDEKSGAFMPKIAKGVILVPENFKKAYKEIFPEIYKQVYLGLLDKTRVGEALIEIFTDFIIRWGRTLDEFSEHHKLFLFEIADRTIKKENSIVDDKAVALEQCEAIPDIKKTRLADEIFKAVEQELRSVIVSENRNGNVANLDV